ncbi:MAG: hypothetical protein JXB88_15745 [Spirochaetales bacterium]|nr:hypothetical protein [Spirochaetales bacterium]
MGFLKKLAILFLFIIYCGGQLFCDDFLNTIPSIEQINTENAYIRDIQKQVLSFDDYSRLKALYSMEKIIKIGTIDSIKYDLLSILYHLSTYMDTTGDKKSKIHTRKKAIELIGRLGEKINDFGYAYQLESILILLLRNDDIAIVSSAVFALGILGYNNDGNAIRAIELAVDKWALITRDNTFALAVITSIERIANANNGLEEMEGYAILIKIMQSYPDIQIREKAFEVMDRLNSYNK